MPKTKARETKKRLVNKTENSRHYHSHTHAHTSVIMFAATQQIASVAGLKATKTQVRAFVVVRFFAGRGASRFGV